MSKIKGILLGLLVAILVLFASFNSHSIEVKYFGTSRFFLVPLWVLVYLLVIMGILIGVLFRSFGRKNKIRSK